MSNRSFTLNIFSNEEIPERIKTQYHGFLPGRHTAKNLIKWMESEWLRKSAPPTETAKEVMKETDLETAIALLLDRLHNDSTDKNEEALLLGQIDPGNEIAITYLAELTEPNQWQETRVIGASQLRQIDSSNEAAITALVDVIQSDESSGDDVLAAAESLAEIDPGNESAIVSLVEELQATEHEFLYWVLATSLGRIDPGNPTAINTLVQLIETTKKYCCSEEFLNTPSDMEGTDEHGFCYPQNRCHLAARSLGEIDFGNEFAITTLTQLIDPTQDEFIIDDYTRYQAAKSLGLIAPGNEKAIAVLIELIEQSHKDEDWGFFFEAVESLGVIGTGNEKAIAALERLIQAGDYDYSVAESLERIEPGNQTAITALVELILDGEDKDELVADSLERILQGDQYAKVVTALKNYMTDQVFKHHRYFYFYQSCHDVLWRCAQNMSYPDFYRAWHSEPSSIQSTEDQATDITS